jgi:hypothetical protein
MDYEPDGEDLPDHDYESIYGRAAMHARLLATLGAVSRDMKACAARLARLEAQNAAIEARRGTQQARGNA